MNDTTRRFLTAIVDRVGPSEIVELRLFPALRQGGIESGVAVVAVQLPAPAVDPEDGGDRTDGATSEADDGNMSSDTTSDPSEAVDSLSPGFMISPAVHALVDTDVAVEDEEGGGGDDAAPPATFIPLADTAGSPEVEAALDEELTDIVVAVEREVVAREGRKLTSGEYAAMGGTSAPGDDVERPAGVSLHIEPLRRGDEDSPYADAPAPTSETVRPLLADFSPHAAADAPAAEPVESIALGDILALPSPAPSQGATHAAASPETRPVRRLAILSARYRLAIKGPDRGKWDVEITHEADAPLDTVERVARGVAKRAGEASDPEHFSGESLRAALEAPVWATTP